MRLEWGSYRSTEAKVLLAAVGAYQLVEVLRAAKRLTNRGVPNLVIYWLEPGRLQDACAGTQYGIPNELWLSLQPRRAKVCVFCTHTRPHSIWGLIGPLLQDDRRLSVLGYSNMGGTLDTAGMLFVNRCSWAHCVAEAARLLELPARDYLEEPELAALAGKASPHGVIIPHPS
jgi:phosphoketolase